MPASGSRTTSAAGSRRAGSPRASATQPSRCLTTTTELGDLAGCDLVIEAIVEELDAKQDLFRALDGDRRAGGAVLATNTSALSVTEIAAATARPERVVGLHFFNPAPVLPLVEVVRTELATRTPSTTAYAFAERLGKEPIRCNDTPGLRRQPHPDPAPERLRSRARRGGESPEDLDKAMTSGVDWPIGPCALIDLIGVDVHVHASEALYSALGRERAWRRRAARADARRGSPRSQERRGLLRLRR